jgi:Domain of unknown function (DUF4365)
VPKRRKNRITERAGVNAARTLFESSGYVFQEVDLGNDYGKDAYVDLVDGPAVTGLCVATQIKSGSSYKRGNDYAIPVEGHWEVWRRSTVPIAGIVFDPDTQRVYWCSITDYLNRQGDHRPSEIPISAGDVLTADTIERHFKPCFRKLAGIQTAGLAVLQLASAHRRHQGQALVDCFAYGRSDPRVFALIRKLMFGFKGDVFRLALTVIAHATPHPDIMWSDSNWVPETMKAALRHHLRWRVGEIVALLTRVAWSEWERGGMGQNVHMLLRQDPDIEAKAERAAYRAMQDGNEEAAWAALYLSVAWAGENGREKYQSMIRREPRFRGLQLAGELEWALGEFGYATLYL